MTYHRRDTPPDVPVGCRAIPLTQGKFAIVDGADFDRLSCFKWYAFLCRHSGDWYAHRTIMLPKKRQIIMHREIINAPPHMHVDHINGDKLMNTRANLRICTVAQNARNRMRRLTECSSTFKGVYWNKRDKAWVAQIRLNNKKIHIGNFKSQEQAARAYDAAASRLHGEFARPNFPDRTHAA